MVSAKFGFRINESLKSKFSFFVFDLMTECCEKN